MVSGVAFTTLLAGLAAQRIIELYQSRQNETQLFQRGAREHAPEQMIWMQVLHGTWFVAMLVEVWLFDATAVPLVSALALGGFLTGQALRYAAMRALKERWTVRVITLRNVLPVDRGIYRYLRHPNYLGVILEIVSVPLLHGAWRTAALFTLLNALLLAFRIRAEETALTEDNEYAALFGHKARLLPSLKAVLLRQPR